ncbi:MAG: histidinol-phosphatase [Acetobacteraceae bacterium]
MLPPAATAFLAAAEAAADAAGAAIRPYFRATMAVEEKADQSPVTRADRAAEQAMRDVLVRHFPEHGLAGEELGCERPDARFCWVLDPIDGTRAFITGRPLFGTLVALLEAGRPILGLLDQPITGERWIGRAGSPTQFTGPLGGRAGCRPCPTLAAAELSATSPELFSRSESARIARLQAACHRVTWGGDCYGYGLLALGLIDIIAESSLKFWDWAALVPIVEGAGGKMTDWEGDALAESGSGQVLAVGDAALLQPALALLAA